MFPRLPLFGNETAQKAASLAGNYLRLKLGTALVEHQKSVNDDLLDVDLGAEQLILKKLREETPTIGILSEEVGYQGQRDLFWVVDPLDGSANFQRGVPLFGISIALMSGQSPLGGVIHLPMREETFLAAQRRGAYLNGVPIQVSHVAALSEAMAHAGDYTKEGNPQLSEKRIRDIVNVGSKTRRLRMIGSAAVDLAYVACGRADLLINHAPGLWDIAAGVIILQEAGGRVSSKHDEDGDVLYLFSNGLLHQALEELLL